MKKLPPKILVNFCISLLALYLVFMLGVERTSPRITCQIIAALLHYLVLSTFCWTLVQSYNLYQNFVRVFRSSGSYCLFITVASIFAWGIYIIRMWHFLKLNFKINFKYSNFDFLPKIYYHVSGKKKVLNKYLDFIQHVYTKHYIRYIPMSFL